MCAHEIEYLFEDGRHEEGEGRNESLQARDIASGSPEDAIREISRDSESWPEGLRDLSGASAPRRLFCRGAAALLVQPGVMVCGSRNASEDALGLAYRCGMLLADSGLAVFSGYARGVDMAAHRGALESGGSTLAFLPYGIQRFRVHRDLQGAFAPENFLAVSELEPWQVFTAYAALRRNKLLAALSGSVIVVEPGETGGTWYSAERARRLGRPLFFLEGRRPEIVSRLEGFGGVRITVSDGVPDLEPVIRSVAE